MAYKVLYSKRLGTVQLLYSSEFRFVTYGCKRVRRGLGGGGRVNLDLPVMKNEALYVLNGLTASPISFSYSNRCMQKYEARALKQVRIWRQHVVLSA